MLKIWGRANSVNVKKALWAIEELKLKYERIDAGMAFGVNNTPEYRAMNPTGLVPTIDDDGFVLWESHAIVRYLAAKHASGTLWPTDLQARADADRWMDWAFTFLNALRPVFWGLVRTPEEKRNQAEIDEGIKKCGQLLVAPESGLKGRKHLGGDAFTMADIPLGCHIQIWFTLPIERPATPNLEAWFKRLCERPAYQKIVNLPLS
ncbi:MAG TPA: glutathione S-transferase [Burkholderiales bacterium]